MFFVVLLGGFEGFPSGWRKLPSVLVGVDCFHVSDESQRLVGSRNHQHPLLHFYAHYPADYLVSFLPLLFEDGIIVFEASQGLYLGRAYGLIQDLLLVHNLIVGGYIL